MITVLLDQGNTNALKKIIFILTFIVICTSCNFKSAEDYFAEAEKLEEVGKYKEAVLVLDKAIQKDDKFVGAYINRGADKSALGDFKGAISDYKTVISIDPDNTMAFVNVGNNYKRLNDYRSSVDYYNRAFDTKGGENLYIDYSSNEFNEKSDFDVPGYQIFFERGIAYYFMDSIAKAYKDLNASLKQNYLIADCNYWIAFTYLKSGQKDMACKFFEKSKSLGNKDAVEEMKRFCK